MKCTVLCPNCRKPLLEEEKRWVCPEGHSFDKAREGYVNLLFRHGGTHGDNREMVLARRKFLDSGHYLPLRLLLCGRVKEQSPKTLLDAGCGEGYYTEGMSAALALGELWGVDISKEALVCAGKRLKGKAKLAVASIYDLPFEDGCFEALTLTFSPYSGEEYRRVLKENGLLYMVIPGSRHLWELKEVLYERPYENEVRDRALPGFEYLSEDRISYTREVQGEDLQKLFRMTPYFYRTPQEGRERAKACSALALTMEFHLLRYRKTETDKR